MQHATSAKSFHYQQDLVRNFRKLAIYPETVTANVRSTVNKLILYMMTRWVR